MQATNFLAYLGRQISVRKFLSVQTLLSSQTLSTVISSLLSFYVLLFPNYTSFSILLISLCSSFFTNNVIFYQHYSFPLYQKHLVNVSYSPLITTIFLSIKNTSSMSLTLLLLQPLPLYQKHLNVSYSPLITTIFLSIKSTSSMSLTLLLSRPKTFLSYPLYFPLFPLL
ncbi:unnamed protein product [Acanthosepion pharaonis]|uniref:Uncharacterized protein n=1 Tax=Acanthosepion pharaonis TaxID=158019 RepID=A0A812EIN2_ACAPH|nr:unnamed protein product [Sepia pharaonis]